MNTPELLAPAGNTAAFYAALAAGADAIYCALTSDFNARRGADNFSEETFAAACRAAHLAGVRVFATMNVVIRETEMTRALELARRAWLLGADALIIQDWGFLSRVHELWPEIELHVSTQANVHDARGVAWCKSVGATRVTLSRELSMQEIEEICKKEAQSDHPCELEVFAHGALCFCYSGVCLMSSMRALTREVRSANRGMCAQPCRLLYDLVDRDGVSRTSARSVDEGSQLAIELQHHTRQHHLANEGDGSQLAMLPHHAIRPLCPKDACSLPYLARLCRAGVTSLKIEGRMKAADYVYSVVRVYRKALDAVALGDNVDVEGATTELRRSFNRDFTDAYLAGASDNTMMSYERSNNRGLVVGLVVASRALQIEHRRRGGENGGRLRGKTIQPAETSVHLHEEVASGDLLEIRPLHNPDLFLTAPVREDARAGDVIDVRTARPMEVGSEVRLIRVQAALDAASRIAGRAASGGAVRSRAVDVMVEAHCGRPLRIELSCDGVRADAEGPTIESARTRALTADDLAHHVGRMGETAFAARSMAIDLDEGCALGFAHIHATRDKAVQALEAALLKPWETRSLGEVPARLNVRSQDEVPTGASSLLGGSDVRDCGRRFPVQSSHADHHESPEICVRVSTPEAALAAMEAGAQAIYVETDDLDRYDLMLSAPGHSGASWSLPTVPILSEICRESDHAHVDRHIVSGARVALGNISELALARSRGALPEILGTIPAHNAATLRLLEDAGARCVWLSPEVSLAEMEPLVRSTCVPLGVDIYGRCRVMTSEHCVLQVANCCCGDCGTCSLREEELYVRDEQGKLMPVRTDIHGRSRIWLADPLDAIPVLPALLEAGIQKFMVDGTFLSIPELRRVLKRVHEALCYARCLRQSGECVGRRERREPGERGEQSALGRQQAQLQSPRRDAGTTQGHLFLPLV